MNWGATAAHTVSRAHAQIVCLNHQPLIFGVRVCMQMLEGAEPLGQMIAWQGAPGTTKYCFEKVNMPDGFMILGDAIASLNPRFATGMTVAALQVWGGWLPFTRE